MKKSSPSSLSFAMEKPQWWQIILQNRTFRHLWQFIFQAVSLLLQATLSTNVQGRAQSGPAKSRKEWARSIVRSTESEVSETTVCSSRRYGLADFSFWVCANCLELDIRSHCLSSSIPVMPTMQKSPTVNKSTWLTQLQAQLNAKLNAWTTSLWLQKGTSKLASKRPADVSCTVAIAIFAASLYG